MQWDKRNHCIWDKFSLFLKDIENKRLPGNQTFDLVGSQNTQCTLDSRAMDFAYSIENFPSGTEEVCATLKTFSQASKPQPVCIGKCVL